MAASVRRQPLAQIRDGAGGADQHSGEGNLRTFRRVLEKCHEFSSFEIPDVHRRGRIESGAIGNSLGKCLRRTGKGCVRVRRTN